MNIDQIGREIDFNSPKWKAFVNAFHAWEKDDSKNSFSKAYLEEDMSKKMRDYLLDKYPGICLSQCEIDQIITRLTFKVK